MFTEDFIQCFSASFLVIYILVAFIWPSWRTYRKTGFNPITFTSSDSAHDFIGKWFKFLMGIQILTTAAYCVQKDLYSYFGPVLYMEWPEVRFAGALITFFSLVWISIAQFQMGVSWRIGIDHEHRTELVQQGLFSISRNPVFLGMLFSLLGFFLVLPNALTLLVLVSGYLLIQIQIRLEEEFLENQHGHAYTDYKKTVRRLI